MSYLKQFILPIKGLGLGRSSFEYEIGNQFFEQFNSDSYRNSEIEKASLVLNLNVNKQSTMIILDFNIQGSVVTQCDRCLDDFNLDIESKQTIYVKFGKEDSDEGDDIIFLSENEHELDISQLIFEFVNLSIPIKKVHGTDKSGKSLCNTEMLNKISNHTIEEESSSDPRWDKLKDLM